MQGQKWRRGTTHTCPKVGNTRRYVAAVGTRCLRLALAVAPVTARDPKPGHRLSVHVVQPKMHWVRYGRAQAWRTLAQACSGRSRAVRVRRRKRPPATARAARTSCFAKPRSKGFGKKTRPRLPLHMDEEGDERLYVPTNSPIPHLSPCITPMSTHSR